LNLFVENVIPDWWDGELELSTIKGKVDWRRTSSILPCGDGFVELDFVYNGASSGIFRKLPFLNFPKWKHPIATCRHDKRCAVARLIKKTDPKLYQWMRKFSDDEFYKDVGVGGTKWEQFKGWIAVRAGALFLKS
jgi:hypothetical protein